MRRLEGWSCWHRAARATGRRALCAINQDAALLGATLPAGTSVSHEIGQGRRAYLVVARGTLRVNGTEVGERDGVAISGESAITIEAVGDVEVLIADLP